MEEFQVLAETMREKILFRKYFFCGGNNHSTEKCFKKIRKDKGKARAAGDSDKQGTERTPCKKNDADL